MKLDAQINRIEMETDEMCVRVFARRQPVARDLRFLTMVLKVVTDLVGAWATWRSTSASG